MITRINMFFIISCCLISALSGLKPAFAGTPTDPKGLFERKCGLCHSIERPKSMRMTRDEWKKTVMRMQEHARVFTDAEAEIIIDYLAEHYGR